MRDYSISMHWRRSFSMGRTQSGGAEHLARLGSGDAWFISLSCYRAGGVK